MRILLRRHFVVLAGLSLAFVAGTGRTSRAQPAAPDRVSIPTFDGMELGGTFYPATGKDAVVLCLHDFSHRKGGGSHREWDTLAARLQKEGYAVLTFDFRGFGNSKSVSPEFWKFRHNQGLRGFKNGNNPAASIDQKDFSLGYYLNLINDIVAARAFLDRKNDAREVNTSNLIVIGAGQGATLGALWMSAEWHRQRDTTPPMLIPPALPQRMDDPEGRDIAAAFWLTISPTLEGRSVTGAVKSALVEVARENKVPTVLVFGANDTSAENLAKTYEKAMLASKKGDKVELKNTGTKTIARTELTGSALLSDKLETNAFLLKHLNGIMEERGSKEWRKRDEEKGRYFWTVRGRPQIPAAKQVNAKVCDPIPLPLLKLER